MTRTPDYFPGQREEESLLILSGSDYPTKIGEITYVSGSGFKFNEEGIVRTFSSSVGITVGEHMPLRQLVHLAEEGGPFTGFDGAVRDIGPIPFVTASIWWTDPTRTKKIVQKIITRNVNQTPSIVQWQAFDVDGITVIESFTDTISYSGIFETSRIRTQS